MPLDLLVVTGRFQPLHDGHCRVIREGLAQASHVIVLIGSPNVARSVKNPFTLEERADMIGKVFAAELAGGRMTVSSVPDATYDDGGWIAAVEREVARITRTATGKLGPNSRIGMGAADGAQDKRYRAMFPRWQIVDLARTAGSSNSTAIREAYLSKDATLPRGAYPKEVVAMLEAFQHAPEYAVLVAEAAWAEAYKKSWASAPFPVLFVTVDCVVRQGGRVLLIRRGGQPGRGLLAMPGGFVDPHEPLREAAIRELIEETTIADGNGRLSAEKLASFIDDTATRVFDAPDRSIRGRTITHVDRLDCPDEGNPFAVSGGDDAAAAGWYRLQDLDPRTFHEHHWFILEAMCRE